MAHEPAQRSPAFQFYPKDFLSSSHVQRMTLTEIGVYIVLLSHAWLSGGVPAEMPELAKLVKMPTARFAKMWSGALSECFEIKDGRLVNSRLESERQKQNAYREKQAEHGKKGGRRVAFPDPSPTLEGSPSLREAKPFLGDRDQQTGDRSSSKKEERLDLAFLSFQSAYPSARRKGGYLIQQAYIAAAQSAGGASALLAALDNHIASDQWSNPKHIPGMDLWLSEERWRQELPAAGAATASANNPKTAGNIAALNRFIERGKQA
jgi:uncharacterized protein YdaU (DUF1376 family)